MALTVSFVAAIAPCWKVDVPAVTVASTTAGRAVLATVLLLVAQVTIANSDVWIVAARIPDQAGRYAAVALIGRLVFVTASSIVTVVFPSLVADNAANGRTGNGLLWRATAIMAGFGGLLTLAAFLLGDRLVAGMMGAAYAGVGSLLWPYALATTCFVVANLFAINGVAVGRAVTPALLAVGAVAQVVVLDLGAGRGVAWVVWAQVVLMGALVVVTMAATALAPVRRRRLEVSAARPSEARAAVTVAA